MPMTSQRSVTHQICNARQMISIIMQPKLAHAYIARQVAQLPQRDARALKSVEILSAAAQLYEKSHSTRRIALSCGIKISPVGSLD